MRKKIGECLIQAGLISEEDLTLALAEHKRTGERIGAVLVRMNLATEKQIAKALAYQLGFPHVSLDEEVPDPSAVVLIPKTVALRRVCIAIRLEKNQLTVAMSDPLLFSLVQDLEFQTGYRIKQVVATQSDILRAIHACYPDRALVVPGGPAVPATAARTAEPSATAGGGLQGMSERTAGPIVFYTPGEGEAGDGRDPGKEGSQTAPIVELVDLIIKSAIKSRASDIHIEPFEKGVVVRHRLDGLLKEVMDLPRWVHDGLIARLKIMAGMDIAEKRLPQDGRLRVTADGGTQVDFRASTLKTLFGEKIVLRILDHRKGVPGLEELGMSSVALEQFRHFLRRQHGMILVVGPTGSGKTTTLSSALGAIQSEKTNIVTIEDPIEYELPGINQTQINERIKLTFAGALRSILRQDPDVILVGEIRDQETARIAMQAAQTGHLVLSTLHTDDAPSAITRLMDLGVEPYVIASVVVGVVAQRLLRRLCPNCRRPYTPDGDTLRALGLDAADASLVPFHHAVGCEDCSRTGYRGRIGIYEVMPVGGKLTRMIAQRASEDVLREHAVQMGMACLGDDGLQKVKSGVTTPEEFLRVVADVRALRTLCPGCGTAIALDFLACPACGRRLGGGCGRCGRALQPGWSYCPYCASAVDAGRRTSRAPRRTERGGLKAPNVAEFKKS